ncbi:hypothetical protein Tco_0067863 [Tanacetum coccineum]
MRVVLNHTRDAFGLVLSPTGVRMVRGDSHRRGLRDGFAGKRGVWFGFGTTEYREGGDGVGVRVMVITVRGCSLGLLFRKLGCVGSWQPTPKAVGLCHSTRKGCLAVGTAMGPFGSRVCTKGALGLGIAPR